MITILFKDCNSFSKELYGNAIDSLQLHMVKCPCGKTGCLIRYGHYQRKVKFMSSSIDLRIQRVWCSECHATNGLLPSILVPYSQIPLKDQQDILICAENHRPTTDVMSRNFLVDESNVRYILKQFRKHWKQRILSLALTHADELPIPCLSVYSMQFMQVRRTPNILFSPPT